MLRELIMSIIAFALVAIVLAVVAARNKLVPPAIAEPAQKEADSLASHNAAHLAWLGALWDHIKDWLEVYWWLPLSILGICVAAKLVYLFTGRASIEDPDAIVGYALRIVGVVCAVIAATVTHQQTSAWLTKEEAKLNVPLAAVHEAKIVAIFGLVLYFLCH